MLRTIAAAFSLGISLDVPKIVNYKIHAHRLERFQMIVQECVMIVSNILWIDVILQ